MIRRTLLPVIPAIAMLGLAPPLDAARPEPVSIQITSPHPLGRSGILLSGDWALVIEVEVRNAVGIVDDGLPAGESNMALIIEDPDGCIHMQGWIAPDDPLGPVEDCIGMPDEVFIRFTPDSLDAPGIAESPGFDGIEELQNELVDEAFDPANLANLNRQYYDNGLGGLPGSFVGASTESSAAPFDGFGYGANDDLPGLYVWADIGTGRVTDVFLNPIINPATGSSRLRNMAGLVNGVHYNQLTTAERTSIVLVMNVARGVLEPIVQFDFLDVDEEAGSTSSGFLRKIDGGPAETILFPDSTPRFQDDAYEEVLASLEPYEVDVGAAVVAGDAGAFIDDMDGNGRYDGQDLVLMGHTLLSDVGFYHVRAIQFEALDTSGAFECPNARVFKEASLDSDPDLGIGCSTGSARSIVRRPR